MVLPDLTERVLREWGELLPQEPRPRGLRYVGVLGSPAGGTTTFLALPAGVARPVFAVKIYRDPEAAERAANEAVVLARVGAGALAPSVPRVLIRERVRGTWVLVESALPGRPIPPRIASDGLPDAVEAERTFDRIARWLADVHRHTHVDADLYATALAQLELDVQEFAGSFELTVEERRQLRDLEAAIPLVAGAGLTAQHGDLTWHNVLVRADGRPGVVDWSDARMAGPALDDLLLFVTTYHRHARGAVGARGAVAAFEDTYLRAGRYSALVRRTLDEQRRRIGADAVPLRTLLGLFLVTRSASELRRARLWAARGILPRSTRSLAEEEGRPLADAARSQLWIHYFRAFAGTTRPDLRIA